jgi:integrase
MVRSRYPYLVQQRRRWFVRVVVPAELRTIVGQSVFKVPTGETDQHRAVAVGGPIIAELQRRISSAREDGRRLDITKITDIVKFALERHGHSWADYARRVRDADYDLHAALRLLPGGNVAAETADFITGHATPFLSYLDKWKPEAGLKPRPLDQAVASVRQFDKAVGKPIEQIESKDVQRWIDGLINADGEAGLSSNTVRRKLGEIRNYWSWLQSHQIVSAERDPFAGRVKDPANRRKTKDDLRQRFRPQDIVKCWEAAEQRGDSALAAAIKIAAYSGARIEGVAQLRVADIRTDPDTGLRFMRMADKTAAGDRFVPIHPEISGLLTRLVKDASEYGYLIPSNARNKYGERSQPLGKRFGRLKAELGFDDRFVFHSIRKTVAHMLETAEGPPGVAKDLLGHVKTDMTFGIYSGETRMDQRARWLTTAIKYPGN